MISPIAIDGKGQRWNINADMVAAAVAKKFNAKLCLITNVSGVIQDDRLLNESDTDTNPEIDGSRDYLQAEWFRKLQPQSNVLKKVLMRSLF